MAITVHVKLHCPLQLDLQDIFNIKLTGVDTFTEERLKSRVTSYRVLAAHSDLTSKLDETSANRGEDFSRRFFSFSTAAKYLSDLNTEQFLILFTTPSKTRDIITTRDVIT